jgi:cytochrome P450
LTESEGRFKIVLGKKSQIKMGGGVRRKIVSRLSAIEKELNPFPYYRQMREEQPVYHDPERDNWNIFRYKDVLWVLSDYETFSSQFTGGQGGEDEPFSASMVATDPPKHRQLRSLVSQAFTPRAVNALEPRIKEIVKEHLDRVSDNGELDIIQDLGYPLPVIVIAEMLGIPPEDREKFKEWSDNIVAMADLGGEVDYSAFIGNQSIMEMSAYFMNMIEHRRENPGKDLISGLLQANIDGETLNIIEMLGFCALLLVAGNETTTNLIGNAMLTFTEHPEAWDKLRSDRKMLPQTIEEVLRYRSPVQSMFRVTRREVEVAGTKIPAGAPLVAWIGSANHDPEQFTHADSFRPDRQPKGHLAFGHGIHYCLGAPLARLEAEIALDEMLDRFEKITLKDGEPVERVPSLLVYGLKHLHLTFENGR